MHILSVNAGSATLKFGVFDPASAMPLMEATIEHPAVGPAAVDRADACTVAEGAGDDAQLLRSTLQRTAQRFEHVPVRQATKAVAAHAGVAPGLRHRRIAMPRRSSGDLAGGAELTLAGTAGTTRAAPWVDRHRMDPITTTHASCTAASAPPIRTCGGSLKDVPANGLRAAVIREAEGTGIYQIVASKRDRGAWPVPRTRHDLYRG